MSNIERYKIDKGINLYVIATPKFKTVSISYCFHRDLNEEYTYNALVPAVLKRGCVGLETMKDIESYLEGQYGAILDVGIQKKGERQVLRFSMDVVNDSFIPEQDSAVLAQAFHFLNRLITQPVTEQGTFEKSYIQQEKENLKDRILSLINDKIEYSMEKCIQNMCKNEKYSRYAYGSVEDLKNIDNEKLFNIYSNIIEESPLDIFVVGDVDPEKIRLLLESSLKLSRGNINNIPSTIIKKAGIKEKYIKEEMDVSQSKLNLGFRTNTTYTDKDYFPLVLYTSILGGGPHSKLFINVREKASLAYYAFARLEKFKGLMLLGAGIEGDKYDQTLDIILKQMEDMKNGSITEIELQSAANAIATSVKGINDQPGQLIDYYLGNSIEGSDTTIEQFLEGIQNAKIDQVVGVAQKIKLDTVYFLTSRKKGCKVHGKNDK